MIYVTGDIHSDIDIHKLSCSKFPEQKAMTKDDYVIICGDFGLVWDGSKREKYWQEWLSDRNFTTLWVDGNHENFARLAEIPVTEKFGGKVQEAFPGAYHLMRGQAYEIDGKTFFTMGGASSHDTICRTENVSWWREELPSYGEMEAAVDTLDRIGWKTDYVITHCAPRSVQEMIDPYYRNDSLTGFLERVMADLDFKHWFFGHYHTDRKISDRFTAVFDNIIPLP